jgi:hypothetical protein
MVTIPNAMIFTNDIFTASEKEEPHKHCLIAALPHRPISFDHRPVTVGPAVKLREGHGT